MTGRKPCERIIDVTISDDTLIVARIDGSILALPLEWYPQLLAGVSHQRENWQIWEDGCGISWPELNIQLDLEELQGEPARSCSACAPVSDMTGGGKV